MARPVRDMYKAKYQRTDVEQTLTHSVIKHDEPDVWLLEFDYSLTEIPAVNVGWPNLMKMSAGNAY